MDVEPTEVRFAEIRGYVEQAFAPQAEEKGLDFQVRVGRGPAAGAGHRRPAAAADPAQPAVQRGEVHRQRRGDAADRARPPENAVFDVPALTNARQVIAFTVIDTGIGISDDKLSLIFEAFQQADGTTSRTVRRHRPGPVDQPGPGPAARRHDHRLVGARAGLDVHALRAGRAGAGRGGARRRRRRRRRAGPAVVRCCMPPLRAAASRPDDRRPTRRLDGATVLIVDDDVRNVFALTSALELHGMTVLYADNGADGVRLLAEHPEVRHRADGRDDAGPGRLRDDPAIRRNHRFADLPIVFLTAKAMPGDRESALAAGASDYITKPVDLDELIELMASWISGEPSARTNPVTTDWPRRCWSTTGGRT